MIYGSYTWRPPLPWLISEVNQLAQESRSSMFVAGFSSYPPAIDFKPF